MKLVVNNNSTIYIDEAYEIDSILSIFLILNLDNIKIDPENVEKSIKKYWYEKNKRKIFIKKINNENLQRIDKNVLIKIDDRYYVKNLIELKYSYKAKQLNDKPINNSNNLVYMKKRA